ncbi:2-dehydropantoate 2-reductase [Amphibacillus marinus]|uniref:2-dehydropantoate 2-reductase n=1 Tax=Amphibacillus marinus TaxID=872970 RepID=A0A1H8LPK6_9BACI|nr:ketopantoate reductase family protein [Amphibacillus marinus]SEO06776.1 2-dehydropantoate 2-reductase [Amphibacillus marinus]
MQIKKIAIIGLGALGVMYAEHFSKHLPANALRIIADEERIERYKKEGFFSNERRCQFSYVTPEEEMTPADLVLITVKFNGLAEALEAVRNQVGEHTIIMSAINGITSEELISEVYGKERVLYCVAQGMDAVKEGNRLTYANKGVLCFGEEVMTEPTKNVQAVARFFDSVAFPYEIDQNMRKRQWGKFMLNVGVNQTVAVYQTNYEGVQVDGKVRDTMIAAMKEVKALSEHTDTPLDDSDLKYWLNCLNQLHPQGKPSMRQDFEAKRYCEVELFSGTVLKLASRFGVETPINQMLYDQIAEIELQYT